ncbi:hypothetical protein E2562_029990 [Oryza meyeriana var. granulata]|uniref:Uncharacterized protein n=1 Tax=Oryza meyeriana var. granulata TaxID=110450 RepID=A0A6G1ER77_9ORYZ|nr:hypothetical protein E2562_029990 [Oryza meyeriana var. granulata]
MGPPHATDSVAMSIGDKDTGMLDHQPDVTLDPMQARSSGLPDQTEVIPRVEAGFDVAENVQRTGPMDVDVASDHGAPLIQHQPGYIEGASIPLAKQEQSAATTHDGFREIPVTPSMSLQANEQMMEPEVHKKIDEICELEEAPPLDQMVEGSAHVDQGNNSMPWSVPKRITRMPPWCMATGADICRVF